MKFKLDRIISIATLVASLIAIILVLKKPAPVAQPQAPAAIAEHAQSFDRKMAEFEQATQQSTASAASSTSNPGVRTGIGGPQGRSSHQFRRDRRGAGAIAGQRPVARSTPDSNIGSAAPTIKDQSVTMDGDVVHGQFLTEIAGKDVWVTVSGHIGEKDGYATFDPTEFKVGDLSVPVSLVNPALQKKLAEERDRLKLPDNVGAMKVQNSELVMQQK